MPAPVAGCQTPATILASTQSGTGGPNINPATGLSTDYLNHFMEAIMLLEAIGTLPECLDDLRAWRPKTYTEHFAASRYNFNNRERVIACYEAADPSVRRALDQAAEILNALTDRTRELILQHLDTPEVDAIARRALERLRPLVARIAAVINGTRAEAVDPRGPQAAIDAIFSR